MEEFAGGVAGVGGEFECKSLLCLGGCRKSNLEDRCLINAPVLLLIV